MEKLLHRQFNILFLDGIKVFGMGEDKMEASSFVARAARFSASILDSAVSTGNDDARGRVAARDFFTALRLFSLKGNGLFFDR